MRKKIEGEGRSEMSHQEHILSAYTHCSSTISAPWKIWQTQTPSQNMPKNLLSIGFSLSSKVFPGLKKIRFKRIIGAEGGMAT